MWEHNYDPLGSPLLSTLVAALPIFVLLVVFQRQLVRGLTAGATTGL